MQVLQIFQTLFELLGQANQMSGLISAVTLLAATGLPALHGGGEGHGKSKKKNTKNDENMCSGNRSAKRQQRADCKQHSGTGRDPYQAG